ncbi:MAG: hypothetical protein HYX73_09410 [Acidobacteria bacterium]|nr:hypothetical protein [Acidobacteriota bacterium]
MIRSLAILTLQPTPLAWDPEMEEAPERPLFMLMIDDYFTVYQRRRRRLVSGEAPVGLAGDRPPHARTWRAYQNRMNDEPAWERAQRYRRMMQENGYRSIRALARAMGEDHSRVARVLKVLDLPECVLVALRDHSDDVRVRAHFTEKQLRHLAMKKRSETAILHEIEQAIGGRTLRAP